MLETLHLGDVAAQARAAAFIAEGGAVAHGFGNFYAITARPDTSVVQGINRMKGRPPGQAGSVVTTPWRFDALFEWDALPQGLTRRAVVELMEHLYTLGPFGFRGPARSGMPDILTARDGAIRTTQVIHPGLGCPSNALIAAALRAAGCDFLYTTSGNRSRHQTGADDEPVHHRADALAADFPAEAGLWLLAQDDDDRAAARYPWHDRMSTTILSFHHLGAPDDSGRPTLVVERHGSLHVERLEPLVHQHGFGLTLGPKAKVRLTQRA